MSASISDLARNEAIATFEAMVDVVSQPGCSYLTSYKQDLYKYDFEKLMTTHTLGTRYLWIVREMGTHLITLGVHPKLNEEIDAVLSLHRDCVIFLVQDAQLKEISRERAAMEAKRFDYTVKNGFVYNASGPLASVYVRPVPRYCNGERAYGVYLEMCPDALLQPKDVMALVQIAQCETIKTAHSFFVKINEILLNEHDIWEFVWTPQSMLSAHDPRLATVPQALAA